MVEFRCAKWRSGKFKSFLNLHPFYWQIFTEFRRVVLQQLCQEIRVAWYSKRLQYSSYGIMSNIVFYKASLSTAAVLLPWVLWLPFRHIRSHDAVCCSASWVITSWSLHWRGKTMLPLYLGIIEKPIFLMAFMVVVWSVESMN